MIGVEASPGDVGNALDWLNGQPPSILVAITVLALAAAFMALRFKPNPNAKIAVDGLTALAREEREARQVVSRELADLRKRADDCDRAHADCERRCGEMEAAMQRAGLLPDAAAQGD